MRYVFGIEIGGIVSANDISTAEQRVKDAVSLERLGLQHTALDIKIHRSKVEEIAGPSGLAQ